MLNVKGHALVNGTKDKPYRYNMERRISVVITMTRAFGLMETSPVISPHSPNSSVSSRNF